MGEVLEAFVKLMDGDEDMLSLDKICLLYTSDAADE